MITFTDLDILFAESIFFKYIGYFLPIVIYIAINYLWKNIKLNSIENHTKKNDDITTTIETDTKIEDQFDDDIYKPYLPDREHVPYKGITEWLDKSGRRFYEIANDRRSIRKFAKNKPVDSDVIENCILAAGM